GPARSRRAGSVRGADRRRSVPNRRRARGAGHAPRCDVCRAAGTHAGRGMRVLELATSPAAAYAGLLLGQLGADVVAVDFGPDPLEADAARYVERHKARLPIDLSTRAGLQQMLQLVSQADALVEDLGPSGLDSRKLAVRRLRRHNPKLVVASISPYGQSG